MKSRIAPGALVALLTLAGGAPVAAAPVDKELQILCDQVYAGLAGLDSDVDYMRVTVAEVRGVPDDERARDTRRIITDHLRHICLRARHAMTVVPPDEPLSMAVDTAEAPALRAAAREREIDALVVAHADRIGGQYRVVVDVIPSANGDVAAMTERMLTTDDVERFSETALYGRTRWSSAWRSAVVPGLGQFYNDEALKGVLFAATQAGLLGAAIGFHIEGRRAQHHYDRGLPSPVSTWHDATDAYARRDWMLGLAAGIWAFGVIDAWLSGEDYAPTPRLSHPSVGVVGGMPGARLEWTF